MAIDQHDYSGMYVLAAYHPDYDVLIRGSMAAPYRRGDLANQPPPFNVNYVLTRENRVCVMKEYSLRDMTRVDTEPHVVMSDHYTGDWHKLPHFAELFAPRPGVQELIVEPATVQSMLDEILKMQAPMQQEARRNQARRDRDQGRQIHAQIISLAA